MSFITALFSPSIASFDLRDVALNPSDLDPRNKGSDSEAEIDAIANSFEVLNPSNDLSDLSREERASATASIAAKKALQATHIKKQGPTVPTRLTTYDFDESENTHKLFRLQVKYQGRLQGLTKKDLFLIAKDAFQYKTSENAKQVNRFVQELSIAAKSK